MTESDLKMQQDIICWVIRKSLEKEGFQLQQNGEEEQDRQKPGVCVTLRISGTVSEAGEKDGAVTQSFLIPPMVWRGECGQNIGLRNCTEDIVIGKLELRCREQLLIIGEKQIPLTRRETELMIFLIENRNRTVSRENLLEGVWVGGFRGDVRAIDGHMKRLRHKLGDYRWCIQTVRGLGYRFLWEEKY